MFNLHLQEEKVLKYLTFPAEQQKTSTASLSVHTHARRGFAYWTQADESAQTVWHVNRRQAEALLGFHS